MGNAGDQERGRWQAAIVALMTEPDVRAAAKRAGCSYSTLRRWLRKPAFLEMLRQVRRATLEAATSRLQQLTAEAVEVLRRNLACGQPGVEVRAAVSVLEQATKAAELSDVLAKVDQLQAALAEVQRGAAEPRGPDRQAVERGQRHGPAAGPAGG